MRLFLIPCESQLLAASQESTKFTTAEIQRYAGEIYPMIAGRPLSGGERQGLEQNGYSALSALVRNWTNSKAFPRLTRQMISELTRTGGRSANMDHSSPSNLVEYLIKENRPYSELLTASSCYDSSLKPIACTTGAPFTAGLLTTRAYMYTYKGRFNLSRAIAFIDDFMCKSYPMEDNLQPRETVESLIPLFA